MNIQIGTRVLLNPLCQFLVDDVLRLQETATIGTVYNIKQWEYSPNNIGVDFGVHGCWWFVEDDLEVVDE